MKLNICQNRSQGDPYVIKANGKYYLYATHRDGVQLYRCFNNRVEKKIGTIIVKEKDLNKKREEYKKSLTDLIFKDVIIKGVEPAQQRYISKSFHKEGE